MNKQGEAGINWTDATWNPVTGCLHGCQYCYARAISNRFHRSFKPEYHPERLKEPLREKAPMRIFVCSMSDLFGEWTPRAWIESVFEIVRKCPKQTFQFLTKNPKRLHEFNPWPGNAWAGATIDVKTRLEPSLKALEMVKAPVRFISFEPLSCDMGEPELTGSVEWIIIGAQTGPKGYQPAEPWVANLLSAAKTARIPVLMKDNLEWEPHREEFPESVEIGQLALL